MEDKAFNDQLGTVSHTRRYMRLSAEKLLACRDEAPFGALLACSTKQLLGLFHQPAHATRVAPFRSDQAAAPLVSWMHALVDAGGQQSMHKAAAVLRSEPDGMRCRATRTARRLLVLAQRSDARRQQRASKASVLCLWPDPLAAALHRCNTHPRARRLGRQLDGWQRAPAGGGAAQQPWLCTCPSSSS